MCKKQHLVHTDMHMEYDDLVCFHECLKQGLQKANSSPANWCVVDPQEDLALEPIFIVAKRLFPQ